MKLLLLTFYYPPDLSAGSFRAAALVKAIQAQGLAVEIDVFTTQPNRYQTYTQTVAAEEKFGTVRIRRVTIPSHSSGMLDQSRSYLAFARQVWESTSDERYDAILVTSGRLMSAVLGSALARRRNTRLFLDIRDIFLETICDVLPPLQAAIVRPVISQLERFAIRRAEWVNVVSTGFTSHFMRRYPGRSFACYTNGIDPEFLAATASGPSDRGVAPLHVVYAGNIGESQGLHHFIPELARRTMGRLRFSIIGDGGRRALLDESIRQSGADNVSLVNPMARNNLLEAYRNADVLFLHLADKEVFRTVLPSKIFEYAATGKPIWAGVAGTAASFIQNEVPNSAIFPPGNIAEALLAFDRLDLRTYRRDSFIAKYSRDSIMEKMTKEIFTKLAALPHD